MSIFSIFVKSQTVRFPFHELKVDMHSHLIPGIDDGAQTIDDSVQLMNGLFELGYEQLITTPHIMQDLYRNTPEIINDSLATLQQQVRNTELSVAAEYYLDESLLEEVSQGKPLMRFSGNHVLIELGFIAPPVDLLSTIDMFMAQGYKLVIAHPERYPYYHQDLEPLFRLKEKGCLLQCNLLSFAGYYGNPSCKSAERLADAKLVDLLGTDLHNARHLEQLQKLKLTEALSQILENGILNPDLPCRQL